MANQLPNLLKMGKASGLLGGLAATGLLISQSMYTVDGGHRAIIFSRIGGIQKEIYKEGLHFRVPWFQYPIIYDIRAKPRKISSPTGSKDLQIVNISLRVLSRPDPGSLPEMYRQLGTDYDERVLPSICNEILKSVVAKFNASQLITQRQNVSRMVRDDLMDRARDFNLILDDVAITELTFGREYTAAVESKQDKLFVFRSLGGLGEIFGKDMFALISFLAPLSSESESGVAQQEAQMAQYIVEKAKQEQRQKIVQAEGEAKSATLIGEAMAENPGYLKLRKIRAAQNIARTLAQSKNRVYLNADSLMMNVGALEYMGDLDTVLAKRK